MNRLKREKVMKWIKRNTLILVILCFMVVQTYMNIQFALEILRLQERLKFILEFLGFGIYNV